MRLLVLFLIPLLCSAEEKINHFAFSMYSELNTGKDMVYSPYSTFSALSMVFEGSRGKTQAQIADILGTKNPAKLFNNSKIEGNDLYVANGLWAAEGAYLLSSFRHRMETVYRASLQTIDFTQSENAIQTINTWTSSRTKDQIPELLHTGDIDKSTRLLLTNAIYFSREFLSPFSPKKTEESLFYPTPDTTLSVPMMDQTASFPYFEDDSVQILSLPFKDSQKSLILLLPKEEMPSLSASVFEHYVDLLKETSVRVKIPKFITKQRIDLSEQLKAMGMDIAFSKEADFSAINGLKDLFLSKVIHETLFSLDEKGVTAAAATSASINMKSSLSPSSFIPRRSPFSFFPHRCPQQDDSFFRISGIYTRTWIV